MTQAPNRSPRLEGLDLARYVALVGMIAVNFRIAMGVDGAPGLFNALTAPLEGRAAATFVVLAGIGLGLAGRHGTDRASLVTLKRAGFLLGLGLLNMTVFSADILHYYAFYFLIGAALLPVGSRALGALIVALNVGFVAMILALDYDAGWVWEDYAYVGLWTPLGFLRNLFFNGWHPVVPWLGFLLIGVIVGRQSLSAPRVQALLAGGGVAALGLAELLSGALMPVLAAVDPELAILGAAEPIPPAPLYFLAGAGAACAVVGICLLLESRLKRIGVLDVLAPAGRQTLTLYIAHILIGMGALEAFGMLGGQSPGQAAAAALTFCLAATVYAFLWAKTFRRGPIEALMRRLAG